MGISKRILHSPRPIERYVTSEVKLAITLGEGIDRLVLKTAFTVGLKLRQETTSHRYLRVTQVAL